MKAFKKASHQMIRNEPVLLFAERAKYFNEAEFLAALQEIPQIEPEEKDKLERESRP